MLTYPYAVSASDCVVHTAFITLRSLSAFFAMLDISLRSDLDSTGSTESSPQTPPSFNQVLHSSSPQTHPLKRRIDDLDSEQDSSPFTIPPPSSPSSSASEESSPRKRIIAGHKNMVNLFGSPDYHSDIWSPELQFAMRAVGRASNPCLTMHDIDKVSASYNSHPLC